MDNRDIIKKGYDAIANKYLASRKEDSEDVKLLEELVRRLPKGVEVLDAGCGAGVPVAHFLSRFFKVTGVDISETQIRLARQLVPSARFIRQDITQLTFPDNSFHAICAYYSIIHIPRQEHKQLLCDFYRLLRPLGLALLCMGAGDLEEDIQEDYLGATMYWSHYDAETNIRMLEEIGFNIIWQKTVVDSTDPVSKHLFVMGQKQTNQ